MKKFILAASIALASMFAAAPAAAQGHSNRIVSEYVGEPYVKTRRVFCNTNRSYGRFQFDFRSGSLYGRQGRFNRGFRRGTGHNSFGFSYGNSFNDRFYQPTQLERVTYSPVTIVYGNGRKKTRTEIIDVRRISVCR